MQGHVDEIGKILSIRNRGRDFEIYVSCTKQFSNQCVIKGSVAIDGTSLTITDLGDDFLALN